MTVVAAAPTAGSRLWVQWTLSNRGRSTVVSFAGEIDAANADHLVDTVGAVLETCRERLIVDLTAVGFVDAVGACALLRARQEATARSVHLDVVCAERVPRRVLTVPGDDEQIEFFGSVAEALGAQRSRRRAEPTLGGVVASLLVSNDFPPKVGGIQSYLWELWRRLPPGRAAVLTTPHAGAAEFDAAAPLPVTRTREPVLLPHPGLAGRIRTSARHQGAGFVVLDPALPLGWVGPGLDLPYGVVLHGAEVTVPAALPGADRLLGRVLRGASLLICAGSYPAAQAARCVGGPAGLPPVAVIPPGVDVDRFRPLDEVERKEARRRLGIPEDAPLVVGVSRLVPRKGFDVLLRASARLAERVPGLVVAVAGTGRDRARLEREARRSGAPVRFLGKVPDAELPLLVGCADAFSMCCRDRWFGLEQEGFGIVFLEAAACGVPVLAGQSGGASEAVVDGVTGLVCDRPAQPDAVAATLLPLLADPVLARRLGRAGRERAVEHFSYDVLAARLDAALAGAEPSA